MTDSGLQGERTMLAWRRTTASVIVVALLISRAHWGSDLGVVAAAVALATLAMVTAAATRGAWRARRRSLTEIAVHTGVAPIVAMLSAGVLALLGLWATTRR